MFMNIGAIGFNSYTSSLEQSRKISMRQADQIAVMPQEMDRDSYIPSMAMSDMADMAIPSGNYNAQGMSVEDFSPVSAMDTGNKASAGNSSAMSMLSHTFRANEDSIQMALDELELAVEDLAIEDNMQEFAELMNKGAENIGVPQVENMEEAMKNAGAAIKEATGSEGSGAAGGESASGSGSSGNETTTEVVEINGIVYLEKTTTQNGISTTTRTKLSEATEV